MSLYLTYVRNPYLDEDITFLGAGHNPHDNLVTVLTEADLAEHEDVKEQVIQTLGPLWPPTDLALKVGWTYDNGDGITYHVVPIHDNDEGDAYKIHHGD